MLMQLGSVTFEVWPFNTHAISRDTAADFAAKETMNNMRPREFMGEGDETLNISGRIFPKKDQGGEALGTLDTLQRMRSSGTAQIVVRGDGRNMGWFLIQSVSEKSSFLASDGVGQVVEFDVSLVRAPKPSPASYIKTLLRLFA